MKDTVILEGKYQRFLSIESVHSNLGEVDIHSNTIYSSPWKNKEEFLEREMIGYNKKHRNALFRIILLYDNIICYDVSDGYSLDELAKAANIQIKYEEPLYRFPFAVEVAKDKEFANYIKPIVMNDMKKHPFGNGYKTKIDGLSEATFNANLFDNLFLKKKLDYQMQKAIKVNEDYFNPNPINGYAEGVFHMKYHVNEVAKLIETSSLNDAIIVGSYYDLDNFQGIDLTQKCYNILRIEYEKIVSYLPQFDSLSELLHFKEKRKKDVIRFRHVLNEMEDVFRNNGKEDAIKSSINSIQKANKELCWATKLGKISKLATYISLPVGILESIHNNSFIGLTVTATGYLTQLLSDRKQKRNNWLSLII